MNYSMDYSKFTPSTCRSNKKSRQFKPNFKVWITICTIVAFLLVGVLTDVLIPGNATVTKTAMNDMIEDVRNGEQVVDAFAAFCKTVLTDS